ncbi:hypothetical protein XENOCAPTIV_021683, partial [Xenoophorus captivus]
MSLTEQMCGLAVHEKNQNNVKVAGIIQHSVAFLRLVRIDLDFTAHSSAAPGDVVVMTTCQLLIGWEGKEKVTERTCVYEINEALRLIHLFCLQHTHTHTHTHSCFAICSEDH